ncbi:MAG: histidine phosphatase family protein [Nocardioidaceae bacterium]
MTLIVLVRHGQASWGQADYDVLSEHGHAQARTLGEAWRTAGFAPTRLLTGALRRHVETAAGVQAGLRSELSLEVVDGLEEFDGQDVFAEALSADGAFPDIYDASVEERLDRSLHRWIAADGTRSYRESFLEFRTRVRAAFDGLCGGLAAEDKVVVVTSGGVIASIVADLLGIGAARWPVLAAPIVNSSIHKVMVRDGQSMLVSFNEHAHLATGDITYA